MDPVVRRKIPACVRSLLTDITPKQEENLSDWPETDFKSITSKDGIALPKRGISETLLTPADGTEGDGNPSSIKPCGLCLLKLSSYTCPRCNVPYCGLACYKSQNHSKCSEEFYKESVLQELKSRGATDEEGKSKMQEILLRLRQSADTDGGMENFLRHLGEDGTNVTEGDTQALDLLSKLAELQSGGDENSHEAQKILAKLEAVDDDYDDDDDDEDLAEKLAGLDVDSLSEEQLWSLLSTHEKDKFENLLKVGGIAAMVVLWRPWWEQHEKETKTLIEELRFEDQEEVHTAKKGKPQKDASDAKKSAVPLISAKIPPLHTLTSKPSPLVQFNLINALYGYTFSLCLFNGDISDTLLEFSQALVSISEFLGAGRVFNSIPEALDAGIRSVSAGGYFDSEDPSAPIRAVEAVAHVLTGRSREDAEGYTLSALSQLRSALSKSKTAAAKEDDERTRRVFFQAGKKCEFFQSWVKENPEVFRRLAGSVWTDFERREVERETLEQDKKLLEAGRGKSRGKGALIEEVE